MHGKDVKFGIYSDEGTETCGGYPGSEYHEKQDAATLASWGVDYLKLDACNINNTNHSSTLFARGYAAMGAAIGECGRNMSYSCSWPAALGNDEGAKPFGAMIDDGCNLWRNCQNAPLPPCRVPMSSFRFVAHKHRGICGGNVRPPHPPTPPRAAAFK